MVPAQVRLREDLPREGWLRGGASLKMDTSLPRRQGRVQSEGVCNLLHLFSFAVCQCIM